MANPKKKQQKENDALAQSIINSGPKETHNPITGQPYDAPLVDEHPGLDLVLMYAQPGSIFTKALAPSMAKGIVNGLANGEGAQALMYGLVPESNIVANTAVRNAQKASKEASSKTKELKKLKQQYEKLSKDYDYYTSGTSMYDWGLWERVRASYKLDDIANRIANLEYELKLPVGEPSRLYFENAMEYSRTNGTVPVFRTSHPTQKPVKYNDPQKLPFYKPAPAINEPLTPIERRELNRLYELDEPTGWDELPFKNGGKIKSIF